MVLYEVNLEVEQDIAPAYAKWLESHMDEMLQLEGFEDALLLQDENHPPDRICWTVHYRVSSRAHLETYFEGEAIRMRADGLNRFGNRFRASRRILQFALPTALT